LEVFMKYLTLVVTGTLMAVAAQAYAGEYDAAKGTPGDNSAVVSQANSAPAQPAAPMKSNAAPVGKTRAEVYEELIRAQQDGTLERLNELYGGG
jgi:hypothetical protein